MLFTEDTLKPAILMAKRDLQARPTLAGQEVCLQIPHSNLKLMENTKREAAPIRSAVSTLSLP